MAIKKVIFIGGTSYSGSTLFDMILSNDPKGFSCGEIDALFYPYRTHHYNPICGCGEKNCRVWIDVLKGDEKALHETIPEIFPEIEYLVFSAKNPFWIRSQMEYFSNNNISCQSILIWKTPIEFAQSYKKRDLKNWSSDWIKYHRLYFSTINKSWIIRYNDLVTNKESLRNACNYLNIPYFEGKEKYWSRQHHTIFGNASAKIHLYPKSNHNFGKLKRSHLDNSEKDGLEIERKHQQIYYNHVADKALYNDVHYALENDAHLRRIDTLLNGHSDRGKVTPQNITSKVHFPKYIFLLKKYKYEFQKKYREIKRRIHYEK